MPGKKGRRGATAAREPTHMYVSRKEDQCYGFINVLDYMEEGFFLL